VRINEAGERDGKRAIVFSTLVNPVIAAELRAATQAFVIEMFETFVEPLRARARTEVDPHDRPLTHHRDQLRGLQESHRSDQLALAHDDGQSAKGA
jgi:regulator of PEP synthase PpsR (kinase-PPPase family)